MSRKKLFLIGLPKQNAGTRVACDIAKTLRKNGFVAVDAAFELRCQGVSTKDIALAPLLSDAQRLDLISAVDQLVNTPTLDNMEEKIMSPVDQEDTTQKGPTLSDILEKEDIKEFGSTGPFNPVSTVIDQDEENDKQREAADVDEFRDPDVLIAHLNADEPDENGTDPEAKDTPSDEDLARLHVALKDPHQSQEGEGFVVGSEATPRIPGVREDEYPEEDPERRGYLLDPDRERLTDVDHILKKEESSSTNNETASLDSVTFQPTPGCRDLVREFVYKMIDGERNYQDVKFDQSEKLKWMPNDWLTLMDRYMIDALDIIADPNAQMVEIRKIAALAVAAMEHIATPARV